MHRGMLRFAAIAVLAGSAPALADVQGRVVEDHVFGCVDKADVDRILNFSAQRNVDAVMHLVGEKKCFVLETGETISVDKESQADGMIKVRTQRSPDYIWTNPKSITMNP
jgi:hypothetical protein